MIVVMLIAGIGAILAGLAAIMYGIPVKEFSVGNTLIFTGVIVLCTGMIVLCISAVVADLKLIARRLADPRAAAADARVRTALQPQAATADGGSLFSRDRAVAENTGNAAPPVMPSASPAPWQEETGPRTRRDEALEPEPAESVPSAAATKSRRSLMFSSSMRRDRERAQGRAGELSASDSVTPVSPPEEGEPAPATFDDAWPKTGRARADEVPSQRRSGRVPSTFAENPGAADRQPSPTGAEDRPAVTVIKSGVVDGMAYSLYSDGSIEAQMPEGLMRFASLDELTAHIERRP
jgi:hypothetical protein